MKRLPFSILLAMALTAWTVADEEHYINLMVGDRAAALGGAYTAISDGPEGAYYNPAGLAFAPVSSFSLSTNSFQYKDIVYHDIWKEKDPTQTIDYYRSSLSFVPNFFGSLQKNGNSAFAFSLTTLDSEGYDQRNRLELPVSTLTQVVTPSLVLNRSVQEAGVAYATLLSPSASFGFGLFANYLDNRKIQQDVSQYEGVNYITIQTSYFRNQRVNSRGVVGGQWAATNNLTLATTISAEVPVYSVKTTQVTQFGGLVKSDGTFVEELPAVVTPNDVQTKTLWGDGLIDNALVKSSVGMAYFFSPSLLATVDLQGYLPIQPNDAAERVVSWNAAVGTEWFASPNFPLRLGLFTNNANTPALKEGETDQLEHVDLYGISGSWGYSTSDFDVSLGVSYAYGAGQTQILGKSTAIQDVTYQQWQVYLSGGYH